MKKKMLKIYLIKLEKLIQIIKILELFKWIVEMISHFSLEDVFGVSFFKLFIKSIKKK
jgi:hypothetical protein